MVPWRPAFFVYDHVSALRFLESTRVRRRCAERYGTENMAIPSPVLRRGCRQTDAGARLQLGAGDVRQLHAFELPGCLVDKRLLHRRRTKAHARFQLQTLERARALSEGITGPDSQAHGACEGRYAR